MSGKKKQPTKSCFNLILFLLFIGLLLIAFSIAIQRIWQIDQSAYFIFISSATALIILLITIGLTTKAKRNSANGGRPNGELLDQTSVIIESIGEGVLAIDEKSNISLINPEAKRISGWTDDALDMNYQTVLQLVDTTSQIIDDSINPVAVAQATGKAQTSREFFLKTVGGKTIPIHLQVSPVANSKSLVVAFRDIKLELEKERQQLEFISTASHEMRTPVAAIDGYLGLIANPKICTIDEKALDYATKAKASSQHLGELFKNLLDISKVDDGRLHANLEAINAVEFTRKLVQNLLPLAETKGLQVIFLPDKSRRFGEAKLKQSLYIQADKQMLTESLTNLIENAIKYTKQGQIEINVTTNKQQEVIISVKDSGIGIPKEDLPHLFQKFYRVDNRDTREINGTGLGLYLTRRMVEHMRGRIWVESELEKGSIFSIAMTRLDQKQVGQLLDAEQVQPDKLTNNKPELNLTDQEVNIVNAETDTPQSNIDANQETSDVDSVIEAVSTEQNPPDTSKILSRESADRLHQLGYNTEDFTITDDNT